MNLDKKSLISFVSGVLCFSLLVLGVHFIAPLFLSASSQDKREEESLRFFRIGTGATDASYYPIGNNIARLISHPKGAPPCSKDAICGVPGLITQVQTTAGSVENIKLLKSHKIDGGIIQSNLAYMAYHGVDLFKDQAPADELRAIASLLTKKVHIIVKEESPIQKIEDLKGKKVAIGHQGSSTSLDAFVILKLYGIGENDFDPQYFSLGNATNKLSKGKIDALILIGAEPVKAILLLAEQVDLRLIPLIIPEKRGGEDVVFQLPHFYKKAEITTGIYPGVLGVDTLSVGALFVVHKDVDEELVYDITKILLQASEAPKYRNLVLKLEKNLSDEVYTIPLHSGAKRAFLENFGER